MKRIHSVLLMALCLLAACEPSPPPPDTGSGTVPETHTADLNIPTQGASDEGTPLVVSLVSNGKILSPSTGFRTDGVLAASLDPSQGSIEFKPQVPGQTQLEKIHVVNTGSETVTVTATVDPASDPTAFVVTPAEFTLNPSASQDVVVTWTPPSTAVSGPVSGQLTLSSKGTSSSHQIPIPLNGEVVRTRVVPMATSIPFDPQIVGTTPQMRELVLQNPTALPVRVDKVPAGSLGPYSVEGLPVEILPKQSQVVTVFFNPSSREQWDRTLQLTSNATEAIAPVLLSGQAIAPVLSITAPATLKLSFGTQALATETLKDVTLKNTGDSALTLKDITLSNTTDFKIQSLNPPQTVVPGGSLTFSVVFNPQSLGLKEATLQFYVDDSGKPLDAPQLKLDGTSSGPIVSFNPSDKVDFGFQQINETASMKILLTNDTSASEALQLVSVSITDGSPDFSLDGSYADRQSKPGEQLNIQVNFKPISVDPTYTGILNIEYQGTKTKVRRTKSILLQGLGATALLNVSSASSFGDVELNQLRTQTLVLKNKGKSSLKLEQVSGLTGTAFSFGTLIWPKELAPGEEETLPITFQPTRLDAVTANLVITWRATSSRVDSASSTTTVPLSGRGAAAKALLARGELGFGEVPIGQTMTLPLRIFNTGSAPLRIDKPNPSAHFRIKDPEGGWHGSEGAQIAIIPVPKGSDVKYFDFQIEFTPVSESPVTEILTFKSNDPSAPTGAEVSLQGTGTRPKLTVMSSLYFGADKKAYLTLQNDGKAPLIISNLNVPPPFCVIIPPLKECVQPDSTVALPQIDWHKQLVLELRVTTDRRQITEKMSITTNEGADDASIKKVTLFFGSDGLVTQDDPFDFGTCAMGESLIEKEVKLWNTAEEDASVVHVDFTGLDESDFETVGTVLPTVPGNGSAELKLRFNPRKGATGQRTATAHIYTNNSDTPLVLELKGLATGQFSGFKDFKWKVDFGTQRMREKKTERFALQNGLDKPIFVKRYSLMENDHGNFTLHVDDVSCRRKTETQEIEIRVGETCYLELSYDAGEVTTSSAKLVLEASTESGDPGIQAAVVNLEGKTVSSILSVNPMEVDFGWVDLGESIEPKEITITSESSVTTQVFNLEVTNPDAFEVDELKLNKELPPGGTTKLLVTFHPKEGGNITGELRLRLQGEQETDVSIKLRGQVRGIGGEGGGYSCGASGGGSLVAGWLLLVALGARRRSRSTST